MRFIVKSVLWFVFGIICGLFIIVFAQQCLAAEVNCFSGKVRIYHGFGKDFVYNDDFLAFTEIKTGHLIVSNGDCIVMAPLEFEKVNVTTVKN